jgi:formamidopyrimidine-DNA glycosylase
MPELPDLILYLEALSRMAVGQRLVHANIADPFVLRTATPPLSALQGQLLTGARRLGKRLVLEFDQDLFLLIHLMIAGRLHWRTARPKLINKTALAAWEFQSGTLLLTEASSTRRAAIHLVRGTEALKSFDLGGLEPLDADLSQFRDALAGQSHTLKRALTDPRLFSGIGNAYSDEILHRARLSPVKQTSQLTESEVQGLFEATGEVLRQWIDRLRAETGRGFPEGVTAFRDGMAVHGRYRQPCPLCGTAIQRIRYADNETNYCPVCQTGGKLLADRSLSRLLRRDWPRTLEELELRKARME